MIVAYVVAGCSGSGKSWVCEYLAKNGVPYVSFDDTKKSARLAEIQKFDNLDAKVEVLCDPTVGVSTFIKRAPFQCKLFVIQETEEVVRERLAQRGGTFTPSVAKRIARMKTLAKKAEFTGTSDEVLRELVKRLIA